MGGETYLTDFQPSTNPLRLNRPIVGALARYATASITVSSGPTPKSSQYSIVPSIVVTSAFFGSTTPPHSHQSRTTLHYAHAVSGGRREGERTTISLPQLFEVLPYPPALRSILMQLRKSHGIGVVVERIDSSFEPPTSRLEEPSRLR